jgi:uncharacterized membrane protein YfcA
MTVLPLFLSLTDCMMVITVCAFFITVYLFMKYRKHVNYRIAVLPLVFSMAGVVAGLTLLVGSSNDLAIKILGGFLIVLSAYFFFFANKVKIPCNRISASTAGLVSGITGGFFNIGGPPLVLYYAVAAKDKKEYIATLQFIFLFMGIARFIYLTATVGISNQILPIIPFGTIASGIGMVIGTMLFDKMPHKIINRVVYVIMAVAGVWYLVR